MGKIKKIAKYTKVLPIRFKPETYLKIQVQAEKEGLELSTWIRKNIVEILRGNAG